MTKLNGLALAVVLFSGALSSGCASNNLGCVTPPPIENEVTKKGALDLALNLEKVVKSGTSVKADLDQAIKTKFAALNDDNTALYLFLKAIECALKEDKIGKDVARELAATVRARWSQSMGTGEEPLTLVEKSRLEEYGDPGREVVNMFQKLGIN